LFTSASASISSTVNSATPRERVVVAFEPGVRIWIPRIDARSFFMLASISETTLSICCDITVHTLHPRDSNSASYSLVFFRNPSSSATALRRAS
jgi:hypothetical protein